MIQVLRLNSPLPSIGDGLELQAVAAAVIGGTALTGGVGTVLGGIVGALFIRVIDNGLVLTQVDANWFKFAIGTLTIFAVVANRGCAERRGGLKWRVDMIPPLISVRHIHKWYSGVHALKGVTLDVQSRRWSDLWAALMIRHQDAA